MNESFCTRVCKLCCLHCSSSCCIYAYPQILGLHIYVRTTKQPACCIAVYLRTYAHCSSPFLLVHTAAYLPTYRLSSHQPTYIHLGPAKELPASCCCGRGTQPGANNQARPVYCQSINRLTVDQSIVTGNQSTRNNHQLLLCLSNYSMYKYSSLLLVLCVLAAAAATSHASGGLAPEWSLWSPYGHGSSGYSKKYNGGRPCTPWRGPVNPYGDNCENPIVNPPPVCSKGRKLAVSIANHTKSWKESDPLPAVNDIVTVKR